MSTAFFVVAVVSAIWGVIDAILMAVALKKRGVAVNMLLFRVYFFRYLSEYKRLTLSETGRVGSLYYSYIVAMNIALASAVAGVVLKAS
ncbi:MAG: hypothetical protein ACOY3Y_06160 [Acidobacteriota bacterium]